MVNCRTVVLHEFVERFGLRNSAGKAIKEKTFCTRILVKLFLQHGDRYLIWHKRAAVHDFLHLLAEAGVILGVPTKKVSGRNVHEAVLLDELFTLSSFSGTGR